MLALFASALMLAANPASRSAPPPSGTLGRYTVLTCKPDVAPPFEAVDITYGPRGTVGDVPGTWLQVHLRTKQQDERPAFEVQLLSASDPLTAGESEATCLRYVLAIPETKEALDYRNIHTGLALLPPWQHFRRDFLPRAAQGSPFEQGLPRTVKFLGHVLTLEEVRPDAPWTALTAKRLDLDPELLVGTARPFKDAEGRRVPQEPEKKDYTYVRFTAEDYATMIAAGSNIFMIGSEQEPFVRDQPVFFCRLPSGKAPLRWPADLYRSNYLGGQMFIDEPAIIAVGDTQINRKMRSLSDFLAVVDSRVRDRSSADVYALEKLIRDRKINLGDLRIAAQEYPIWETLYETAFYQMRAGGTGFIQEGRYRLENFRRQVAEKAGVERQFTPEEMFRYYYAVLRGGASAFGKHWGMSIYGQCEPATSALAMAQAYDMGARYIWFWTSDHEFHIPWNEQMALTRQLRAHQIAHPRRSIAGPAPMRDLAIVVPYGSMASLESLWFIRELDPKRPGEASAAYRKFLGRVFQAVNQALEQHEDFDITVDDGREIRGYRRVVRVSQEP